MIIIWNTYSTRVTPTRTGNTYLFRKRTGTERSWDSIQSLFWLIFEYIAAIEIEGDFWKAWILNVRIWQKKMHSVSLNYADSWMTLKRHLILLFERYWIAGIAFKWCIFTILSGKIVRVNVTSKNTHWLMVSHDFFPC